jgi:hypothetical protein
MEFLDATQVLFGACLIEDKYEALPLAWVTGKVSKAILLLITL